VVGCWRGYLSGPRCRLAYFPADATAAHRLLLQKIQIGFTFLVTTHPGSPGKKAVKRARVFILFEKYINILALEMVSPGNRHCADCIGTLSFPVTRDRRRL